MHTQIVIPKGTDKVTVELTVKEAIALGGAYVSARMPT
jgi:hypothetical protein